MSFHRYNETLKSDNLVAMSMPSPCKTTVFKPRESAQKPKGLSIRSNSDMNVFFNTNSTREKENTYNSKELKIPKSKSIKRDYFGYQKCSLKEQQKYPSCEHRITGLEGLTPNEEKREIDRDRKTQKALDNVIFKKPLLPKRFIEPVREPENLAHFYDVQNKFDYEHVEKTEQGFMDQFLKEKENISYEEKDSEMLLYVEIPKLILSSSFDEEYIELSSPELPYIPDDDM